MASPICSPGVFCVYLPFKPCNLVEGSRDGCVLDRDPVLSLRLKDPLLAEGSGLFWIWSGVSVDRVHFLGHCDPSYMLCIVLSFQLETDGKVFLVEDGRI